uniref:Integrin subunit alpha 7 n=1 Tax=Pelodiscus sinensis TaxID=13735 RepID=K7F4Y9_PELSI
GNLRVELFNQSSLELGTYDDGPYEAGGEKDQDPSLIPVPANSYFVPSLPSGQPAVPRPEEGGTREHPPRAAPCPSHLQVPAPALPPGCPGESLACQYGAYDTGCSQRGGGGWSLAKKDFGQGGEGWGGVYMQMARIQLWEGIFPGSLALVPGGAQTHLLSCSGPIPVPTDLAVGAPFDGAGKVYIYHGSSLGIVTKPTHPLNTQRSPAGQGTHSAPKERGRLAPPNLKAVVHSEPDKRGKFLFPAAARSRRGPAGPAPPPPQRVGVDVQACFSYTASPDSYSPRLMLAYTLDADVDRRKRGQAPRVAFLDGKTADPEHQFTDVVELPHQHAPVCVKATFQLQDSIRDKLRPITVELTYSIKRARSKRQSQGSALPPLVPVLNALQPSSQRAEVRQGPGDVAWFTDRRPARSGFRLCRRLPLAAGQGLALPMSDQKFVALEIQVTNLPSDPAVPHQDGDDAHEALLTVTFPEALPYAGIRSHESWALPGLEKQPCLPNLNASQVQCELGNPMKRGAQVRFYLIASTSGITIETRELELELTLSTPATPSPRAPCSLADPRQLFFGGRVLGESAMRSEGQVGSAVRFEVTVS